MMPMPTKDQLDLDMLKYRARGALCDDNPDGDNVMTNCYAEHLDIVFVDKVSAPITRSMACSTMSNIFVVVRSFALMTYEVFTKLICLVAKCE